MHFKPKIHLQLLSCFCELFTFVPGPEYYKITVRGTIARYDAGQSICPIFCGFKNYKTGNLPKPVLAVQPISMLRGGQQVNVRQGRFDPWYQGVPSQPPTAFQQTFYFCHNYFYLHLTIISKNASRKSIFSQSQDSSKLGSTGQLIQSK